MSQPTGKTDKYSPLTPANRRELTKNLIRLSTTSRQAASSSKGSTAPQVDPRKP